MPKIDRDFRIYLLGLLNENTRILVGEVAGFTSTSSVPSSPLAEVASSDGLPFES